MKKILLVSNHVFHYRVKVYNYFYEEFKKRGYEFSVLAPSWQDVGIEPKFNLQIIDTSSRKYIAHISKLRPDIVITFLHLKDTVIFPVTLYCRMKKVPVIYWNHGINLETPDAKLKNSIFRRIHDISDAIVLYSPNEKKYVSDKNSHKLFVGYNTLNLEDVDTENIISKEEIRQKYEIQQENIVLFVGRIKENKRLDVLLDNFKHEDIAVVVVGKGISEEQKYIMDSVENYYYLGEIWDAVDFNSIFNSATVFSIPGHLGLGLNEAFFWGKPVVTMNVQHPPEVYYLKNGYNGFMTEDGTELKEKIMYIIRNKDVLSEMSRNARKTAMGTAHISNMFSGFMDAVDYVQK